MNAEGVSKHSHYRLKVDLSRFFHDARQYCWIFVDGAKVQRISHIEQHIARLFSIQEPFHLLLNDTDYLPPTEDARILEKNETILVIPGSGIDALSTSITLSDINVPNGGRNSVAKLETCNGSVRDKKGTYSTNVDVIKTSDRSDVSRNVLCDTSAISTNTTADAMFYSVIDDIEMDTDSKATDSNLMEERNNTESSVVESTKRKRIRKHRPKNRTQTPEHNLFASPLVTVERSNPKKPKIIDSYVVPTGKHIRFDNTANDENDENDIAKKIVQEMSRNEQLSYASRNLSSDLSALLALGKSSTPMFVKRKKTEVENSESSENETRSNGKCKENEASIEKSTCDATNEKKGYYKGIELEKLPLMARKPQIKDIIAFKTLKIGADYTPQLSEFIVTEVIEFCAQSANYTLRILEGKEELQVPLGKFSFSEDETTCSAETFLLNHKQMKELRLIL